MKENITAITTIIISTDEKQIKKSETKLLRAIATGGSTGLAATVTDMVVKKVFIAIITNPLATTTTIGLLTGAEISSIDLLNQETYDSHQTFNKLIETSALHFTIGFLNCLGRVDFWICVMTTTGCGLFSTFGTQFITDTLYSKIVPHLNEESQSWWDTIKLIPIFSTAATIRVICKCNSYLNHLKIPHGGSLEVYQDTITAAVMTGVKLFNQKVTSEPPADNAETCQKCTCAYLHPQHYWQN